MAAASFGPNSAVGAAGQADTPNGKLALSHRHMENQEGKVPPGLMLATNVWR